MGKFYQILLVLSTSITSCYYDVEDELYITCEAPEEVSFSEDVNPLIQQGCAISGCHVSSNSNRVNLETYQEIKASVDNGSFQSYVIVDRSMPPSGPLNDCEIAILNKWINQGAPNN